MRKQQQHTPGGISEVSIRTQADKMKDEITANPVQRLAIIEKYLSILLEGLDEEV